MGGKQRGLYRKYVIEKADGSPVDPAAEYFVLRVDKDSPARSALIAYARACRGTNPALCVDLVAWVRRFVPGIGLKPEDLPGMEYVKEECLTCPCLLPPGCDDCPAEGSGACDYPADCEPMDCVAAHLEATCAAYREALEAGRQVAVALDNLLERRRAGVELVGPKRFRCNNCDEEWNLGDKPLHAGRCEHRALLQFNALLFAPDPAQGIVERLEAGDKMADLIRSTTNFPVEFYEALAGWDKAVGRDA